MPCVYDRDGVQFYLNFTPGHLLPHVHVYARGREATLAIATGELLIGQLTRSDLRYAQQIIAAHRDQLLEGFAAAANHQRPERID